MPSFLNRGIDLPITNPPRRWPFRPRLEILEDRLAPAVALEAWAESLRVVLISDAVTQADRVAAAAAEDVIVRTFDSQEITTAGLLSILEGVSAAHGGIKISQLGVVAHGRPGEVVLGEDEVWNQAALGSDATLWRQFRDLLTDEARLDLYSCNVAAGSPGQAFVDALAAQTGADVYASDNVVGSGDAGDLDWEYVAGAGGCSPQPRWRRSPAWPSMIFTRTMTAASSSITEIPMINSPRSWDGSRR
jgi:hypothetical protein